MRTYTIRCAKHSMWNEERDFFQEEVKGEHAFEMYGHRFFVHNAGFPHRFTVSEESTGFNVSNDHHTETRKSKAIEYAKGILEKVGEETFRYGIGKANRIIEQHFVTPSPLKENN